MVEPYRKMVSGNRLEKIFEDGDMPSALQGGLARWQDEQRSGIIPERRAPWAIPGWHAEVERWIADQVIRLGRGAIQSIEPIKSWSISCVLKVTTETGNLYFKAPRDLPLFVNEGVVLARLVELYPDRLPIPVALAPEQGWMLLDDFGDPLGRDATLDQQAHLMQDFARMQINSSRKIEVLLAAGCKDRRLEILPSQIEPLFDDEFVLSRLTLEERGKLKPGRSAAEGADCRTDHVAYSSCAPAWRLARRKRDHARKFFFIL